LTTPGDFKAYTIAQTGGAGLTAPPTLSALHTHVGSESAILQVVNRDQSSHTAESLRYSYLSPGNMPNSQHQSTHHQRNTPYSLVETAAANASAKPMHLQQEPNRWRLDGYPTKSIKPKRKHTLDATTFPTQKKQKMTETTQKKRPNQDQNDMQHPHCNSIQPIGNLIYNNPLTNVERWRLRGWTWPEAVFRTSCDEDMEVESPGGTKCMRG
jgi:hypothetical protein